MQIDPWGAGQVKDYARLRDEFGIAPFGPDEWGVFERPHDLMRRGIVFGHRDFARVADAVRGKDPWAVMTGLMPSGDMHMGHKMVVDQVVAHQKEGGDVHIAIADYEAVATRGLTLAKARALALDQYVHNYLALGLDPERLDIYFQTGRRRVRDLADRFAQKVNWSQLVALYGFAGETRIAHIMAPIIQAADILHVQAPDTGSARPILVPVGVDQDPHIRLARDLAGALRHYSVGFVDVKSTAGEPLPDPLALHHPAQGDLGIFVRGDGDAKAWLDLAEATLGAEGYGELRRNDAYRALYLRGAGASDLRRVDLALARAEQERGGLGLVRPSATFHRFMTALDGGKMSSSRPETSIFLTDEPEAAMAKLKRSITGGRDTAEEQRKKGANPDVCPVYETYLYHLARDDEHLQTVYDECRSGARLCGECKGEASGLLVEALAAHKERRDEVAHRVEEVVQEE